MQIPASLKHSEPDSLEDWTHLLCTQEMPIFSNTVQKIITTLNDKHKGAMDLSSDILQDPNLTARLLKMSNSSYFNPSRQSMSTISRAIVILGSNTIREITLACSYFESILSAEHKQKANEEIAKAIHAAVQAKALAVLVQDPSPEEVFIAALLNNIGHISFWCFCNEQGGRIQDLMVNFGLSESQAEKKVLGFCLSELGSSLIKSWALGGLIDEAINNPTPENDRAKIIQLSHELTLAIKKGWDTEQTDSCITRLVTLTKIPKQVIKLKLEDSTQTAVKIARQFGANDASKYIQNEPPMTKDSPSDSDELLTPVKDKKQLQLQILHEIAIILSGKIDNINLLLETTLEGIHRGVGMDRTMFALLSTDNKVLQEKFAYGWVKKIEDQKFTYNLQSEPKNIFVCTLNMPDGKLIHPASDDLLFTPQVVSLIGKNECILIPVIINEKPIGLIYTDRAISHLPLNLEDFNAVKRFTLQANIGLKMYQLNKFS